MLAWAVCSVLAAFCVRRDAGSKYLLSAALAAARSARADSNWRASTPRRALSSLSLRFSRRKKVCSGASKMASGWSMRLTRTRPRASSRTTSQLRCKAACHQARSPWLSGGVFVGAGVAARRRVAAAWATAFSTGSSSTWRTRSSRRASRPAVSVTVARVRRSRSRPMARCTGARRGWAARSMRWLALLSAATRGSRLPVSCACCCARRMADSMSTTRFSSRERDRLCMSSSSWLRCSATSLTRASATDRRAAVSRTSSSAWRAMVRASMACAPESAD